MNELNMPPLLRAENLLKRYPTRQFGDSREEIIALAGVSISICKGRTLAVVGESGSGKSTLAFCLAGLESPTSGTVWLEGRDVAQFTVKERRALLPEIQLIFQDPANSLNPRWNVREILFEPFVVQGKLGQREMEKRAVTLLRQTGLSPDMFERLPTELSGGQRQRLAIARALALAPKLMILDEALSALDCSVQAQIANLLMELQSSLGMAYLFITHDLAMAAHLADEIAVMNRGQIVEQGLPGKILKQPEQETTQQLLAATPSIDGAWRRAAER